MLLSAIGTIFGMRPDRSLLAELRRIGFIMPSRTRSRSRFSPSAGRWVTSDPTKRSSESDFDSGGPSS